MILYFLFIEYNSCLELHSSATSRLFLNVLYVFVTYYCKQLQIDIFDKWFMLCTALGLVKKRIVFGFTYNLQSTFTAAIGTTITQGLQTALSTWNTALATTGAGVCTDGTCSNTNVNVFNSNGQAGVTITLNMSP